MTEPTTFVTSVFVGHRAAGVPFGRFQVSDDHLAVSSWPRGRWVRRSVAREDVKDVRVTLEWWVTRIRVDDSAGAFHGVRVEPPFRGRRIIANLRKRGYPVTDLR